MGERGRVSVCVSSRACVSVWTQKYINMFVAQPCLLVNRTGKQQLLANIQCLCVHFADLFHDSLRAQEPSRGCLVVLRFELSLLISSPMSGLPLGFICFEKAAENVKIRHTVLHVGRHLMRITLCYRCLFKQLLKLFKNWYKSEEMKKGKNMAKGPYRDKLNLADKQWYLDKINAINNIDHTISLPRIGLQTPMYYLH